MAALKAGIAVLMLAVTAPAAQGGEVEQWRPFAREASARFGIPLVWIEQVITIESGGHLVWRGRPVTSSAGAMGLMQLMPATWAVMREQLHLGTDPYDPHDNILAGSFYLRQMYMRFGYPGLFGAYNAGPARYAAWTLAAKPLPLETRNYLSVLAPGPRREPGVTQARRPPPLGRGGDGSLRRQRGGAIFALDARNTTESSQGGGRAAFFIALRDSEPTSAP